MNTYLVRSILLILLWAAAAGCGAPVERSDVLITNARLIDGTGYGTGRGYDRYFRRTY